MFHTCVERFDVTSTVAKILGTKRAKEAPAAGLVLELAHHLQ